MDDEPLSRRFLNSSLKARGFSVGVEPSGERAVRRLEAESFDVVLLDLNHNETNGISTCRQVRRGYPQLGIVMLTVRQDRQEKLDAFLAGADDCVVKSLGTDELVARVNAVAQRGRPAIPDEPPAISVGDILLSWRDRSLIKGSHRIHVTPNEFALLHCLMSHPNRPVSYAEIFHAVWELNEVGDLRRVRSLVRQLRRKIEPAIGEPGCLVAYPGLGYRFLPGPRADYPGAL